MDDRTLRALRKSIQKWQEIVDGVRGDGGVMDCALCHEFQVNFNSCPGCPVAEKSGSPLCRNTPYVNWNVAVINYGIRHQVGTRLAVTDELVALARAELEFLKSLLPTEKKEDTQ